MSEFLHFSEHTLQEVALVIMAIVYTIRLIWIFRFQAGKACLCTRACRHTWDVSLKSEFREGRRRCLNACVVSGIEWHHFSLPLPTVEREKRYAISQEFQTQLPGGSWIRAPGP